MQSIYSRPEADDRTDRMPGAFPSYAGQPQPPRLRVRPPAQRRSVTKEDAIFSDTASSFPSMGSDAEPTSPRPARRALITNKGPRISTQSLASRFSRGTTGSTTSRQTKNTVRFSIPDDDESDMQSLDPETESLSSELSTDTSATTVGSDVTLGGKNETFEEPVTYQSPSLQSASLQSASEQSEHSEAEASTAHTFNANSAHNRLVVRRVPSQPTVRVKARMPRTRPSFETYARTIVAPSARRTLHVQISQPEATALVHSQELEQYKRAEKELLDKIDKLEAETKTLRDGQTKLIQDLDEATERLASTGHEMDEAKKERNKERQSKEQLLHDMEEQRKVGDEYRSNFEFQKGILDELEKERDDLLLARADLDLRVVGLEKDVARLEGLLDKMEEDTAQLEQNHKDKSESLVAQVAAVELAKTALDELLGNRDKELEALTADRDALREESDKRQGQIELLIQDKKALEDDKKALEDDHERLQARIYGLEEEKNDLKAEVDALASEVAELKKEVSDLEEENGELAKKLEEVELERDGVEQKAEEEKAAYKAQLDAERDDYTTTLDSETANIRARLEADNEDMRKQMAELTLERDGVKMANVSLASQKLEQDKVSARLQESLTNAESEVAKLKDVISTLTTEKDQLSARVIELQDLRAADDIDGLHRKLLDLEDKAKSLQEQANKVPELEQTRSHLEQARSHLESKNSELQAEADKVPGLAAAKDELEAKSASLQSQIDKMPQLAADRTAFDSEKAAFDTEKASLEQVAARVPGLEQLAARVPGLADQNASLTAQLQTAQQQLMQTNAAYQSSSALAKELQARVEQLESQALSGSRSPKRSRSSSVSRQKKKGAGSSSEKLVMLRNPQDRGTMQIVRRCDLHTIRSKSSSSAPDSD